MEAICKLSQFYFNNTEIKKKRLFPEHDKEMIDGKVTWRNFNVSSVSSSTTLVVSPRGQVTESMRKHFGVSTIWFHPPFPVAICPSFRSPVLFPGV